MARRKNPLQHPHPLLWKLPPQHLLPPPSQQLLPLPTLLLLPPLHLLLIFSLGVWLMRSAGCVINDYADRWLDPHVERTKGRPLATGEVSPREALAVFVVLCLVAFVLVLFTNRLTILLSGVGVLLAASYPYLKRYTWFPQVYLGMAFGWSIPMGFAAVTGEVPTLAWLVFSAPVWRPGPLTLAAQLAGFAIIGWAAITVRRFRVVPEIHHRATLCMTGPYRWVRHPMYTGVLLLSAAWTAAIPVARATASSAPSSAASFCSKASTVGLRQRE